jgi:hypothetical protein
MPRKYGFSFSWKRAFGISAMKQRMARRTGIPLTRSGMDRKVGRAITSGCALRLLVSVLVLTCVGTALLYCPR